MSNLAILSIFLWLSSQAMAASGARDIERFKEHIQVLRELIPLQNTSVKIASAKVLLFPLSPVYSRSQLSSWHLTDWNTTKSVVKTEAVAQNPEYGLHTVDLSFDLKYPISEGDHFIASHDGSMRFAREHSDILTISGIVSHPTPDPSPLYQTQLTLHLTSIVKVTKTITHYLPTTVSPAGEVTSSDNLVHYLLSKSPDEHILKDSMVNSMITVVGTLAETSFTLLMSVTTQPVATVKSIIARKPSNMNAVLNNKSPGNKLSIKPQFKHHNRDDDSKVVRPYSKPKTPLIDYERNILAVQKETVENRELSVLIPLVQNGTVELTSRITQSISSYSSSRIIQDKSTTFLVHPTTHLTTTSGLLEGLLNLVQTFSIEDGEYVYDIVIENDEPVAPTETARSSLRSQFEILHVPPSKPEKSLKPANSWEMLSDSSELQKLNTDPMVLLKGTTKKHNSRKLVVSSSLNYKEPKTTLAWLYYYDDYPDYEMDPLLSDSDCDGARGFLKNGATGFIGSNTVLVMLVAMVALWL